MHDLFQPHQRLEHQPAPGHAVAGLQSRLHFPQDLFVEPDLLFREIAVLRCLDLLWQVSDNRTIRLHSAKDIRPDQPSQRCEPVLFPSLQVLDERLEYGRRTQQAGVEKIE